MRRATDRVNRLGAFVIIETASVFMLMFIQIIQLEGSNNNWESVLRRYALRERIGLGHMTDQCTHRSDSRSPIPEFQLLVEVLAN